MKKKTKAAGIMKLLKQGYTPREIKDRMAVSESYIHAVKKLMAAGVEAEVELKTTLLNIDPDLAYSITQGRAGHNPGEFIQADTNVDAILDERATTYGSFKDVSGFAQEMKNAIRMCNNSGLDDDQIEALDMIASKIGRIVNGNPNYADSWIDIAGYATLVADRLQGKIR